MKILVADDVPSNRKALSLMLGRFGACDEVESGEQAIAALEAAWKKGEPYDFLCLDFLMPDMTGAEVLEYVRKREAEAGFTSVKILCVTSVDERAQLHPFAVDSDAGYIEKPVSKAALEQALEELNIKVQHSPPG